MSNIKAIGDSIIVEQEESPVNDYGLVFKDTRSYRHGVILSVGSRVEDYRVGDRIVYVEDGAKELEIDNEIYHRLASPESIYCKIV